MSESAPIFIGHAHGDRSLVDKLVDTFVTGLNLRRKGFFVSSLEELGVRPGRQYLSELRDRISGARAVLFMVTPRFYASPFCLCEMGAAWALGKEAVPVLLTPYGPAAIHEVLQGIQGIQLTPESGLDQVAQTVAGWTRVEVRPALWNAKKKLFEDFLRAWLGDIQRKRAVVLDRGDILAGMVDSVLYMGTDPLQDLRSRIVDCLRRKTVLPTTFAYLGESGLRHWLDLTTDPAYESYQESMKFFRKSATTIADACLDAARPRTVDFVSLGPGNGYKDRYLLSALARSQSTFDPEHYYYPFDINPEMITTAVRTVTTEKRLSDRLRIKAIIADFVALDVFRPVFEFRTHTNVLSLLGNTLGNMMDDRGFLEHCHASFTSSNDLLLLEVKTTGSEGQLGDPERNKRFDFGPLETLGIPYDENRITYLRGPVRGTIPNGKTTVATYDEVEYEGRVYKDVKLSYVHEYDLPSVERVLGEIGFRVINRYDNRHSAVLLLRRGKGPG